MKSKGMTVLALLAGVVCALAVLAYTGAVRQEAEAARTQALARYGGDQVEVCVAARDLAPGEVLDASNTEVRLWLVDLLPEGALSSADEAAGEKLASPVLKGEVVSRRRFEGEAAALSVPAGLQAVSVEMAPAQALGGAVVPGDEVDVYAQTTAGAALVVGRAQVLAVGQGSSQRMWVTLAVGDGRVQELIATAATSSLYFALPARDGGQAAAGSGEGAPAAGGEAGVAAGDGVSASTAQTEAGEALPAEATPANPVEGGM